MIIKIDGAGYCYRQGFQLEPVSCEIKSGTFMVLIGPNGSGKSTLFSLINGRLKPDTGSVFVKDRHVTDYTGRQRARLMGTVPQTSSISFDYTVEELVSMGRYPHQGFLSYESEEDRKVILNVLERLDLFQYRERSVRNLSGGEYQRVLLARVLVQQTEILLLDEPGNHLDLKHQTMLLSLLKKEVKAGRTVIAVLHDLNQALQYGDNGLLLNKGKCIASGNPSKFLNPELINRVFDVSLKEYRNEEDGSVILGLDGSSL